MAGKYGSWAGRAEDPEDAGKHVIPSRYPFAEVVPEDGARCSTCYYLSEDREHCRNTLFQQAMETDELGAPAERYCCMVWSGAPRTA